MKILILSINYSPELTGIGKYTGEMAEWLASHGHTVRVVTAPPYYPTWNVFPGYRTFSFQREHLNGVDVWRCPLWVPAKPSALKRLIHLTSFALSSLPVMLCQVKWRPDVVMVIQPPFFCAPSALLVSLLTKACSWLHVQDFEVPAFFRLGFGVSTRLEKLFTGFESCLTKSFDRVSTISFSMVERLQLLGVEARKCQYIPNWVDVEHIRPLPRAESLRSRLGISDDTFVALYSGNMGKKQGLEMVIEAAMHFQGTHPEVLFLLVGDGAAHRELKNMTEDLSLANVKFLPLLPLAELPNLFTSADLHLVIQKRGAADVVMPSKLTGILAAGGTVLITADQNTELGRLVEKFPAIGIRVAPEDVQEFIDGVEQSIRRIRANGYLNTASRAYAEKYLDKNVILGNLERAMEGSV